MAQEIRGTSVLVDLAGAATSGAAHTGTVATRVRIVNELASGLNTVVIGAVAATADREAGLTYSFKMHPGDSVIIEKQVGQTITPTGAISYTPVVYR
jgi:hypothetical protein|tara:strand:+ start:4219 stop:4509 length:291 start_codon:yes stop_codon:yes gene_type:complete